MGIQLHDPPLHICPIHEKDLAQTTGTLRTLRFAFQKVSKGFLVIGITLRNNLRVFHNLLSTLTENIVKKIHCTYCPHTQQVENKWLFQLRDSQRALRTIA